MQLGGLTMPPTVATVHAGGAPAPAPTAPPAEIHTAYPARAAIEETIRAERGNVTPAAQRLGLHRQPAAAMARAQRRGVVQTGTLRGFPYPPAKDSARQAELRPRDRLAWDETPAPRA